MGDLDVPRTGGAARPHPSRLAPGHARYDEILRRHDDAVAAGSPTYLDPDTGYQVMTAATLLERGTCCDTGCRHCPYLWRASGARASGAP